MLINVMGRPPPLIVPKVVMTPEGPYKSKWCKNPAFLVSDYRNGKVVYVIVHNNQQRAEGIVVENIREGRAWLKRNGYNK